MQGLFRAVRYCQEMAKVGILRHSHGRDPAEMRNPFARLGSVTSLPPSIHHKGLENTTFADVLMTKGGERVGSWLWCRFDDTVHDAVMQMAENNVGSLVVLKPGDTEHIAGIITEIGAEGRPAKYTRVGEIMTEENKLITVTSDTNILHAMRLMTENHIRHVPVIHGKVVGMISIV